MTDYALQLSDTELVRYEMMAARALEHEREQWTAAGVVEGAVVADIGCGPGAVSIALARQVGPTGRVLAFDGSPDAVDMARLVTARAGVANVTVEAAPADATGVAPGSVDVAMIRHVLAHNGGREAAIVGHAATLVRPGGCVYLIDIDGTGVRARPSDPDLDDLNDRYWQWHAQQGNDLSVGLRLDELLAGAGLEIVEFSGRYDIVVAPLAFARRAGRRARHSSHRGWPRPTMSPAGRRCSPGPTANRSGRPCSSRCSAPSAAGRPDPPREAGPVTYWAAMVRSGILGP